MAREEIHKGSITNPKPSYTNNWFEQNKSTLKKKQISLRSSECILQENTISVFLLQNFTFNSMRFLPCNCLWNLPAISERKQSTPIFWGFNRCIWHATQSLNYVILEQLIFIAFWKLHEFSPSCTEYFTWPIKLWVQWLQNSSSQSFPGDPALKTRSGLEGHDASHLPRRTRALPGLNWVAHAHTHTPSR